MLLSEVQVRIIDVFVRLTHIVGLPKSVGEIYGFLFGSTTPVSFEDVVKHLAISSGSASQGLKFLRAAGAVNIIYVPGERRDHYLAETDLRKLASGFLRENLVRHLIDSEDRLFSLHDLVIDSHDAPEPTRNLLKARVETLRTWHSRAKAAVPVVLKALDN